MSSISETGIVFDIERFATKDGPGIRTVVFLKGCNLKCTWCQNPESQKKNIQVMYDSEKCRLCGRCAVVCPSGALEITETGIRMHKNLCTGCGKCVESCFYDARKISGKYYTVHGLMEEILKDKSFYDRSGGGVTFSGGEPMLQTDFLRQVLQKCGTEGIKAAIETAGNVPFTEFERIAHMLDLIYFDIKHVDGIKHRKFTGCSNSLILENLGKISRIHEKIIVRVPVIPLFNSGEEEMKNIFSFLRGIPGLSGVELLPFHRLGETKYRFLDRKYEYDEVMPLDANSLKELKELGMKYGLKMI